MKRNKIRYKSNPINLILITLTDTIFLMYRDENEMYKAKKGDMLLHPCNDAMHSTRLGDYESTGFSGYFKVDVHDGKVWQPVILNEIFLARENHFSKTECPIDTFFLCEEYLKYFAGKTLRRTYRELASSGALEAA